MESIAKNSTTGVNKQLINVKIRWMVRRDMAEVLQIEQEAFEYHWNEEDFLSCMHQRNVVGMVAEHNHQVVGFMIYELHKMSLHILNFAVKPTHQRQGVGTQMVEKLINKLNQQRRHEITLEVRETNLPAQLFFHEQGFRAVCVLRKHYHDSSEDAYVMQYHIDGPQPKEGYQPVNRVKSMLWDDKAEEGQ